MTGGQLSGCQTTLTLMHCKLMILSMKKTKTILLKSNTIGYDKQS
jgi:hypothetical protein